MGCHLGVYRIRIRSEYIKGAVFDHKAETAGLGAEITQQWFMDRFVGEKVFDNDGNWLASRFQNK